MTKLIKLYEENPNERLLNEVVDCLKKGGLVIYPTDTVYGLGCSIDNQKAIVKLAALKGIKPEKASFSFVCHSLSNLSEYVKQIDTSTYKTLKANLPGPYTFILPGNTNLPSIFKKKKTVGIRIPDNNIARELVKKLGKPILSSSIHDEDDIIEYTTDPELIYEKWKNKVDIVIDGGYGGNMPSSVISLLDGTLEILREGKGAVDHF